MSAAPHEEADAAGDTGGSLRIRRRWLPWRLRLRGGDASRAGLGTIEFAGDIAQIAEIPVVGIVVVPFAMALFLVGAALAGPFLLVLVLELLLLLAVLPVVILLRALRGQPWPLDARNPAGAVTAVWWAPGWRAARVWAGDLQERADAGAELPAPGTLLVHREPTT